MSGALFDPGPLTRLAETFDFDFAAELLDIYLSQLDELATAVKGGLPESDPQAWARAAHSLKSSSLQVGALALADLCHRIETGQGIDPDDAAEQFTELVHGTRAVIEAERKTLPGRDS
jgi:HPt (histidine-containing phosphotransfer) domain-containing protein